MRSLHIEFVGLDRVDGSATFSFGERIAALTNQDD